MLWSSTVHVYTVQWLLCTTRTEYRVQSTERERERALDSTCVCSTYTMCIVMAVVMLRGMQWHSSTYNYTVHAYRHAMSCTLIDTSILHKVINTWLCSVLITWNINVSCILGRCVWACIAAHALYMDSIQTLCATYQEHTECRLKVAL